MKKNQSTLVIVFVLLFCSAFRPGTKYRQGFKKISCIGSGRKWWHHIEFTKAARPWLDKLAADSNFTIDYIENANNIDEAFLSGYQLFIQLDYPPYGWPEKAVKAFQQYIEQGKGGWIGLHHATLLGEFDGFSMWQWFYDFMGRIRFKIIYQHLLAEKLLLKILLISP